MFTKRKKIFILILLICYLVYLFTTTSINLKTPWHDIKYIESSLTSEMTSNKLAILGLCFLTSTFRYFKHEPQSVTNEISFFLRITSKSGDVEYIHWASEQVVHSYNKKILHCYTLPFSTFAYCELISIFF